jgi:hypothetical protein
MSLKMLSDQVPIVTACSFDLTRSNFFDIPKTKDARFLQFRFSNEVSVSIRSIDVQTLNECLDRFSSKDKKSKSNDSTMLIVEDEKEAKIDQDNESKTFMIEFMTEKIGLKFIEQKESVRSRTLFVHSVVANSEAERKSIQKGDCVCTWCWSLRLFFSDVHSILSLPSTLTSLSDILEHQVSLISSSIAMRQLEHQ